MEIKKVIVSHGRAHRMTTHKFVDGCILCVAESQKPLYAERFDLEIVTHPDDVVGLAPKRQWIFEKFRDVFMLDDDLEGVYRVYTPAGYERPFKVSSDVASKWIDDLYNIAKQYGANMFGFSPIVNPLGYRVSQPITHNKFIEGGTMGLIWDGKLHYPKYDWLIDDDYWMNFLNAYYNRYSIMDSRLAFGFNKTGVALGGLAEYRTTEVRKQNYIYLRKNFGESVIPKKPSSIRKNLNSWEQTMNILI